MRTESEYVVAVFVDHEEYTGTVSTWSYGTDEEWELLPGTVTASPDEGLTVREVGCPGTTVRVALIAAAREEHEEARFAGDPS